MNPMPIEYGKLCQCTGATTEKRESVMTKNEAHESSQVSNMEHQMPKVRV